MPAPVGRGIGVSQRWWICSTTTEANARMTALTMTDSGPKPVTRATTFTRCDETYTLVTIAAPITPGTGRSGTTRRMTTQPGTKNRIGQTVAMASSGSCHVSRAKAGTARTRATAPAGLSGVGRGSATAPSSAGGSTAG